jgi:hypothetical protein
MPSKTRLIVFILAGFTLLAADHAGAVSPQTWRVTGVDGWGKTKRDSVGVTSEGSVGLSMASIKVKDLDATMVWDLLPDGNGVLAATGDGGILYRVDASGKASELAHVVEPEITSLGRDGKGDLLFGTSPDGLVYRLEGGKAVPWADTPETYIWRILPLSGEQALVATGNAGKVYRIRGRNQVELFADLGTTHVTGLEAVGDGYLATTGSPGRLVHLDRNGTSTVLYEADEPELRSPLVRPDGTVYFLANPSDAKGAGKLCRRTPSGAVETVWSTLSGFTYRLGAGDDGSLWVTTGSDSGEGSVVRVHPGPPSTWMEIVKVHEPQVLCAVLDGPGRRWLGTGGQGAVYRLPGAGADHGRVTSDPEDAGGTARWGALSLEPGRNLAKVEAETRSGNTSTPDATWSPWTSVALSDLRGPVKSPSARFLQWRLTLTDPATRVDGVRVIYLPANLAPRVNEVQVTELGAEYNLSWDRGQPASLTQDLPGGVHVEFQVPSSRSTNPPASDEQAAWARRYRAVTWKAEDPNDDDLRYRLEIRTPDEDGWKPLAHDLTASPWIWDSATVSDGWYVLRITASDRAANPPAEADSATGTTEPFLVDNTPPAVSDLAVKGGVLTGRAVDATSPLKKLEVAVDGAAWERIFPEDGIPDMPTETIRSDLTPFDLSAGDHVILVRAVDDAGNTGVGRVSFRTP